MTEKDPFDIPEFLRRKTPTPVEASQRAAEITAAKPATDGPDGWKIGAPRKDGAKRNRLTMAELNTAAQAVKGAVAGGAHTPAEIRTAAGGALNGKKLKQGLQHACSVGLVIIANEKYWPAT